MIKTSDGDLRRAITYLQSASRLHSITGQEKTAITSDSIVEIAGVVPTQVITDLGKAMGIDPPENLDGDVEMAPSRPGQDSSFDRVRGAVSSVAREGFSITQLLIQLHDYIIQHPTLGARVKAECALQMAEMDKSLTDGADEELQLLDLCLHISQFTSKN